MIQQTVDLNCSTSDTTASYTFSSFAKVAVGQSQCYLLACINGPRNCGTPVIIQDTYTEAVANFDNIQGSPTVELQVYTECIGPTDDVIEVIIDNLNFVTK